MIKFSHDSIAAKAGCCQMSVKNHIDKATTEKEILTHCWNRSAALTMNESALYTMHH